MRDRRGRDEPRRSSDEFFDKELKRAAELIDVEDALRKGAQQPVTLPTPALIDEVVSAIRQALILFVALVRRSARARTGELGAAPAAELPEKLYPMEWGARVLDKSVSWLYTHKHELPFVVEISKGSYKISPSKLRKFINERTPTAR